MSSYTSEPYQISIPASVTPGTHTYYIAADGYDSSGTVFEWDSQQFTITIDYPAINTPSPTGNTQQNKPPETSSNFMIYLAAITITVVIVVFLVILLMMRKRKHTTPAPATQPYNNQPQPPTTPEDGNNESQQDFNI
jgi:hypothetical protein